VARDAAGGVGGAEEGRGEQAMMLIRAWRTDRDREGRVPLVLTAQPSETCRRRSSARAAQSEAASDRPRTNAATLTFVSSGDVKADLQMIDLLLEEASR